MEILELHLGPVKDFVTINGTLPYVYQPGMDR
jgi:hypothetical protein